MIKETGRYAPARAFVGAMLMIVAAACMPAKAQHQGDVWVGVTPAEGGGMKLAISPNSHVPDENYQELQPTPTGGFLQGWEDDDPGFSAVITDEPEFNLSAMQAGAEVWLVAVSIDHAFVAIDDSLQFIDQAGELTLLGGFNLHEHISWLIDEENGEFDPDQCVWHATFVLRDLGSTGYADSDPFTFKFTNAALAQADGDFDGDGHVDLHDHEAFAECMGGPGVAPSPDDPAITTCEVECLDAFDFDEDRDVDLADQVELIRRTETP